MSGWTPERRAAQAERMRALRARMAEPLMQRAPSPAAPPPPDPEAEARDMLRTGLSIDEVARETGLPGPLVQKIHHTMRRERQGKEA